jgi:hypothetical protein
LSMPRLSRMIQGVSPGWGPNFRPV